LSAPRAQLAATSVGSVALFAGGRCLGGPGCVGSTAEISGFSPVVDLYDAASGQWSTASLSQARHGLAATSVGSLALFAGGWGQGGASDAVDLYDASTGQWRTAVLSQARGDLVAFTAGGYAIFAGGDDGQGPSAAVDLYDPVQDAWYATALAEPRSDGAAAVVGGEVLLAAGEVPGGVSASVERLLGGLATVFASGASGCPCGNPGASDSGCASSTGQGARLALACALAGQGAGFVAEGLVPQQAALLFAGTSASAGAVFGDGILGLRGALRRLAARTADAGGSASWPQALVGSALPGGPWSGGAFRYLQVWYRDPISPCGSGVNLTNGLRAVLW
jgi:hypothetical protein